MCVLSYSYQQNTKFFNKKKSLPKYYGFDTIRFKSINKIFPFESLDILTYTGMEC